MKRLLLSLNISLLALAFILLDAKACSVSVSEYIMDNHYPDMYELVYFHDSKKVSDSIEKKHNALEEEWEDANVNVSQVNAKNITSPRLKKIYEQMPKRKLPYYALFNGNFFARTFEADEDFKDLAASPLRDKIMKDLKRRALCSLIILKSGKSKQDKKAVKAIKSHLEDNEFNPEIKYFELSRDDKEEQEFVNQILKVEFDLDTIKETMVFGVYGKLRVLEPLVGDGITADNLGYLTDFLASDCSCLIKGNYPGADIVHIYDWEDE